MIQPSVSSNVRLFEEDVCNVAGKSCCSSDQKRLDDYVRGQDDYNDGGDSEDDYFGLVKKSSSFANTSLSNSSPQNPPVSAHHHNHLQHNRRQHQRFSTQPIRLVDVNNPP